MPPPIRPLGIWHAMSAPSTSSIDIETIAGVPSFNAAAARLDIPLTEVDDTMAVLPAAYGIPTIERLLSEFDTLVLLKVKPLLDDIIDLLAKHHLLDQAVFIEKAGSKEERIFRDVASLKGQKVNYLSLMLVKNPGRIKGELIRGCRSKTKEKVSAT